MPFPVDEKYIIAAETELDVSFPDSYRNEMMKMNGGEAFLNEDYFTIHPFFDASDRKRIKRTTGSNVRETLTARKHYRLPEDLIVIGTNGGGDAIVFKINKDRTIEDRVYFLDHENDEITPVANDFIELQFES